MIVQESDHLHTQSIHLIWYNKNMFSSKWMRTEFKNEWMAVAQRSGWSKWRMEMFGWSIHTRLIVHSGVLAIDIIVWAHISGRVLRFLECDRNARKHKMKRMKSVAIKCADVIKYLMCYYCTDYSNRIIHFIPPKPVCTHINSIERQR